MNYISEEAKKGVEEGQEEQDSSILANFKHQSDEIYLITEKRIERRVIPVLTGTYHVDDYYFVGLKDEIVYELRVPSKLYYRTITGEELTVQEGSVDAEKVKISEIGMNLDNYQLSLTSDGKGVIYRTLIKE